MEFGIREGESALVTLSTQARRVTDPLIHSQPGKCVLVRQSSVVPQCERDSSTFQKKFIHVTPALYRSVSSYRQVETTCSSSFVLMLGTAVNHSWH